MEAVNTSGNQPDRTDEKILRIVKLLLDTGRVDVNYVQVDVLESYPSSALTRALCSGYTETARFLLGNYMGDPGWSMDVAEAALRLVKSWDMEKSARLLVEKAGVGGLEVELGENDGDRLVGEMREGEAGSEMGDDRSETEAGDREEGDREDEVVEYGFVLLPAAGRVTSSDGMASKLS